MSEGEIAEYLNDACWSVKGKDGVYRCIACGKEGEIITAKQ